MLSVRNFINIEGDSGGDSESVKTVKMRMIRVVQPCVLNTDDFVSVNPFEKAVNSFTVLSVSTEYN